MRANDFVNHNISLPMSCAAFGRASRRPLIPGSTEAIEPERRAADDENIEVVAC
jgi:hypothetical protein